MNALYDLTEKKDEGEFPIICKDGSVKIWDFSSAPMSNLTENRRAVISMAKDITERVRLEEDLRQSEKMQAIGQLAGGLAHDFNNQLAGIMCYAALVRSEVEENSAAAIFIKNIITGVERSADLTGKLLAFARKGKYEVAIVDMNAIISEVFAMLTHSIDKRIGIIQHLDANPSTVSGDSSQLENVVLNIAFNSRDAMPKGGELKVSTEIVTLEKEVIEEKHFEIEPGEYLKISISDNGTGIEPEVARRIFEPFFTTKEIGKGVGMGLASAYGTIKNHFGAIEIESKRGQGTTVRMFLPSITASAKGQDDARIEASSSKAQILIVDDEELVAKPIRLLLLKKGYEVLSSNNGKEALEIFKESWRQIDIVLLDVVMPEMDGQETFHAMKEIDPEVKVILISGYSAEGKPKEILKEGAKGFLQKPIATKDMYRKIAEVLEMN